MSAVTTSVSLNVDNNTPGTFSDESEHVGRCWLPMPLLQPSPQREDHLVHAMATRDLIGQAKGILMEQYKIARSTDNNQCTYGWPPPIVG
jgi:hypothetical protein